MKLLNKGAMLLTLAGVRQRSLIFYKKALAAADGVEKTNKRGAMFGLDARIALAIFGALSVISGAALYSAIQNSQATALLSEMQKIGKAWEQYLLDTGVYPETLSTDNSDYNFYVTKTTEFLNSTVDGWNGPYLSYDLFNPTVLDHPRYGNVHIIKVGDATWGDTVSWGGEKCTSGKQCYIWVQIDGIDNESILKIIDEKVDNGDGADEGVFRWSHVGGSFPIYSFYKYAPIKNPND